MDERNCQCSPRAVVNSDERFPMWYNLIIHHRGLFMSVLFVYTLKLACNLSTSCLVPESNCFWNKKTFRKQKNNFVGNWLDGCGLPLVDLMWVTGCPALIIKDEKREGKICWFKITGLNNWKVITLRLEKKLILHVLCSLHMKIRFYVHMIHSFRVHLIRTL